MCLLELRFKKIINIILNIFVAMGNGTISDVK